MTQHSLSVLFARTNRRGWQFPILMTIVAALIFSIPLANADFDITHFIVAGDKYVKASELVAPVAVLENSDGYDGQFYYRFALNPNATRQTEFGITIDHPAWRMQRIGYSLLAYVASLGKPEWVPYALVILNFLGLAAIAWFAQSLRAQLALPSWLPIAIMAWPGYVITLVHDTTEIAALAFMMAALSALFARRLPLYALLAGAATLTRETSILIFGGVFAYQGLLALREGWVTGGIAIATIRRAAWLLLALLPFLAWRHAMAVRWGASPMQAGASFIGLPLVGIYQKLAECVAGTHVWATAPALNRFDNALVFITVSGMTALAASVAIGLPRAVRANPALGGLALGWIAMTALLFSLTSLNNGPWVDMTGYFRGCTEFWAVSMILLSAARPRLPIWIAAPAVVVWASVVAVNAL